ncbi:hypothetical protein L202_08124 [Cryptococcus amylolentus CBS 6039]|uniref:Transcription activator GCR1-like domain-containing protein n=2 Tax=Cryptococcus amylolentus TaxID=104669 RepID=A0A1E3H975_9TREE|nr:hypothetical protein L202_08124 [Cryptococcus amylolentus CBS 6039]ODN72685.1 hypothetical protein L202_08124 [Cryptococcus amylolentus CBS 6039]ODN97895.1 hypothetical protein I350_07530 [Cryptococcus amylolentus CBS 6273]
MPQPGDDTLAHLASISLPSHSPSLPQQQQAPPSQTYTPNLAPAFTRIYDAIESLKHASSLSSHSSSTAASAQAQALLELERSVRALNAGIVDDVRRAVEEGVRKGVREGMEGMVLRVEWKEPGVGRAVPQAQAGAQPQSQAQQGQGQREEVRVERAAPVNATAGPSRPANNTSSPTAWNLSGLTGLGNLSSAAENSQLSSLFSLAQQSQSMAQPHPHPAVHTPSHSHPHPIPASSDTPLSSFSLGTPSQNFTMSREVKSVPDLWKEYTIGWDGQPAVRDIYEGNPRKRRRGKRFRDDSERKFYRRRKKVLEMVEALVEKGVGEEEAVERVERLRDRRKCTLNKLGEIIPEMTSEEIALV